MTVSGPTGRSHRAQTPTPSIKHCLNATVRAADHLDDWIRQFVVEHPLRYGPTEFCADQSQSAKGQKPVPAFSRVSASYCRPISGEPIPSKSGGLCSR
jgi:hypothetical protein